MKPKKRIKGVRSKGQPQKGQGLCVDNTLPQQSKSNDKKLVIASLKNSDIIDYVNLSLECLEGLGIEPVLVPSSELNSKNDSIFELVDLQDMNLAYEFFKSEISSREIISRKTNFTEDCKSNPSYKSCYSLPKNKPQQEVHNNNKIRTKKKSVPKADETKELYYEFSIDDNSNKVVDNNQSSSLLKNSANNFKNLKISICNHDESDKSKKKVIGDSFKNYNVIIKSNNILSNKKNLKLEKQSVEFIENKFSSQINKISECHNLSNFCHEKKDVLCEKPDEASPQTIYKNDEKKGESKIMENSFTDKNSSVPKDFLAQAKHMKVTLKDSKRTLKISPNSKNDSRRPCLKRKHTPIIFDINSESPKKRLKIRKMGNSLLITNSKNAKKCLDVKGEFLDSTSDLTNKTSLEDPYEDNILSTIMDKEVLLELKEEENIFSKKEILSPENYNHSDVSFPSEGTLRNYNLQFGCVKTYETDENDSNSDSECSFKRRKNRNSLNQLHSHFNQGLIKDSSSVNCCTPDNQSSSNLGSLNDRNLSSPSTPFNRMNDISPTNILNISSAVTQGDSTASLEAEVFQTGNLDEVLKTIEELYAENNIQKAVSLCQRYLSLRLQEEKIDIFLLLFTNIINSTKHLNPKINYETLNSLLDDVYKILQENNLCNSEVCSVVILESFSSGLELPIVFNLIEQCINYAIAISEEAIKVYTDCLYFHKNMSGILVVSDYVRNVYDMRIPKYLLHYILKLSIINFQTISEPDFRKVCSILRNLDIIVMDDDLDCDLIMFFKCCIENDYWLLISSIFASWSTKDLFPYIQNLCFALAASTETGNSFEKFAAAFFGNPSLNENQVCLFTQIGVSLMLEEYVNDNLDSALKILMLLHKYNINYVDLQLPVSQVCSSKLFNNPFDILIFKETVIHTAVDILMHFRRSKDAFDVSQEFFEKVLSDINDPDLKTHLLIEKYTTVMKIAPLLITSDPFGRSLVALHILLSIEEQGLTLGSVESFIKKVSDIYNGCLASLLNEEKLDMVVELLDRKYGEFKDKLKVFYSVRRGLVVTCGNNGMIEKAKRLFYVGYIKKCYILPKINKDEYPSYLCIKSCWSSYEIKFAIELFFQKLHPFFKSKDKGKPMKCFSIRMRVRPLTVDSSLVNCLQNIPSDYSSCEQRIRNILLDLDPKLVCIVKQIQAKTTITNCLEIPPDIFYDYWKSKLCSPVKSNTNRDISVNIKKRISFGISEPERNAEDFKKITQFLLAKIFLKHDDLNAENKQQKAEGLAISFIRENQVLNKLDKRSMKLLNEFSEKLL